MPGHVPRTRGPVPPVWFGKSSNPPDVWADPTGAPGTATASAVSPVVEISVTAPAGSSTASAATPTVTAALIAPAASSTASSTAPTVTVTLTAPTGSVTANATPPNVGEGIVPPAGTATATGAAPALAIITAAPPSSGGGGPSLREVADAWTRRNAHVTVNALAGNATAQGGAARVAVSTPTRTLPVEVDEFALVELLLA